MSVCAVLANPAESKGQTAEHIVVRHITSSENKIAVETDHYDRHVVRHDWASDETKQFIWKTDLLGGGRLFHLIYRLSLLENLNNFTDTHWLWLLATSPSAMISQEVIRKTDMATLPFPENEEYSELSETEKILQNDVSEYYVHSGKAVSEKGAGWKLNKKVSTEQLESFGKVFCDVLNPIYAENGNSWQCGKFYQTQSFTICQFGYGKNQGISFQIFDKSDDIVNPLIYDHTSDRGAIFTRVCRYYKHLSNYDYVFLIKPNAIRYWLDSVAIRDADETFADLKKFGC